MTDGEKKSRVSAVCLAVILIQCSLVQAAEPQPSVSNSALRLGVGPYQANKWGVVGVRLVNPTSQDTRILVSSSIESNKTNQYGREFWVPANSRRTSWRSLFMPQAKSETASGISVESIVTDRGSGDEKILKTPSGAIMHDGTLSYSGIKSPTAVIVDLPDSPGGIHLDRETIAALNAVHASQYSGQTRRAILEMSLQFLPPVTTAWDGVKHIVLVGNHLADDAAAVTAVRRWLMRGGRMWIMLDQVNQNTVERLLGDGCPYHEVDRVGLTTLRIRSAQKSVRPEDSEDSHYEQPVPFVRTIVNGVKITHTLNGWPATFQQNYGRGKIIYTTLGMRAWIRRAGSQDQSFTSAGLSHAPNDLLKDLMLDFYSSLQPPLLKPELFDEYLVQKIGYEVVELKMILVVLSTFCGVLLLAGMWLIRTNRFRPLNWVGPVLALSAASVLVAVGSRTLHSVPNTVATVQLVEVTPESDDVNVTGLLAIYRQNERKEKFSVIGGGMIALESESQPGETRRMVWTDIDRWHWENTNVPLGVNLYNIQFSRHIKKPIRAVGKFGPEGLSGLLETGPFKQPGDAILATASSHRIAVKFQKNGSFEAGPDEMLTRGNYIQGLLLSDEQRRRQNVYRKLLPKNQKNKHINKPLMFVWTNPIESGFQVSADEESGGSAFLTIPLQLERTLPGQQVKIPGTFLPYRGIRGPEGFESSGHLNISTGEWLERSRPARTWMRIQLPPEVLPLRMKTLTVTLQISGKNQPLKILGLADGKPRVVATRTNPVAIQRIVVEEFKSLKIDDSGGITFGLFVGDTPFLNELKPKVISGEKWNIDFLHVEITGTTLEEKP